MQKAEINCEKKTVVKWPAMFSVLTLETRKGKIQIITVVDCGAEYRQLAALVESPARDTASLSTVPDDQ